MAHLFSTLILFYVELLPPFGQPLSLSLSMNKSKANSVNEKKRNYCGTYACAHTLATIEMNVFKSRFFYFIFIISFLLLSLYSLLINMKYGPSFSTSSRKQKIRSMFQKHSLSSIVFVIFFSASFLSIHLFHSILRRMHIKPYIS